MVWTFLCVLRVIWLGQLNPCCGLSYMHYAPAITKLHKNILYTTCLGGIDGQWRVLFSKILRINGQLTKSCFTVYSPFWGLFMLWNGHFIQFDRFSSIRVLRGVCHTPRTTFFGGFWKLMLPRGTFLKASTATFLVLNGHHGRSLSKLTIQGRGYESWVIPSLLFFFWEYEFHFLHSSESHFSAFFSFFDNFGLYYRTPIPPPQEISIWIFYVEWWIYEYHLSSVWKNKNSIFGLLQRALFEDFFLFFWQVLVKLPLFTSCR